MLGLTARASSVELIRVASPSPSFFCGVAAFFVFWGGGGFLTRKRRLIPWNFARRRVMFLLLPRSLLFQLWRQCVRSTCTINLLLWFRFAVRFSEPEERQRVGPFVSFIPLYVPASSGPKMEPGPTRLGHYPRNSQRSKTDRVSPDSKIHILA